MVKETELYQELGVSPEATDQEIKTAYRKMALKYHPDKTGGDAASTEKFKKISEAYEVLSEPARRQQYDTYGKSGPSGAGPGGFGGGAGFGPTVDPMDLFSTFFGFGGGGGGGGNGGGGNARRKPPFISVELQFSLEELYCGTRKEVEIVRKRTCRMCKGHCTATGKPPPTCQRCRGTGAVRQVTNLGGFITQSQMVCPGCNGRGKMPITHPCTLCSTGEPGVTREKHRLAVTVAPGAADSDAITFNGAGHELPGFAEAGDVLVVIEELVHPFYRRLNVTDLLVLNCKVPLAAVFTPDFAIPVELLDGRVIHLHTPKGSGDMAAFRFDPKHAFIVENEGMPIKGRAGDGDASTSASHRGRLYVPVEMVFPARLKESALAAVEKTLRHRIPEHTGGGQARSLAPYNGAVTDIAYVDAAGNVVEKSELQNKQGTNGKKTRASKAQKQGNQRAQGGATNAQDPFSNVTTLTCHLM